MLSSLTRHFNETVFRGPDTEGTGADVEDIHDDAVDATDDGGTDGSGDDLSEAPVEEKRLSVREQIKKSMAETAEPAKPKRANKGQAQAAPKVAEPLANAPAAPTAPAIAAPDSLSKEAKAAWEKAPPEIQAAFVKREQDMAAGVAELKNRYSQIDQALAPHTDALRAMNATPGDAVNRLFLWFKALASQPAKAFPELARNMGIDWNQLTAQQNPAQPATINQDGSPAAPTEIPEPVKNYVGSLERQLQQMGQLVNQIGGRFGQVESNLNAQNEARTRENLSIWSNGKPYFEDVRQDMAKLIETGIVPLKDGQVDLDTAYERAIYLNPEVRAKVLAEQQQANAQVQQQAAAVATTTRQAQANKARRAAVSLPVSTPGTPSGNSSRKPPGKMSVKDSIKAAMEQLRDQ